MSQQQQQQQQHFKTLIIGTGISGIVSSIELKKRLGFHPSDFLIVDKSTTRSFGGTWKENTYPGAACDVLAHVYSLSEAPNPSWSEKWPPQPEILAYLEGVAQKFRLHDSARFGTEVVECRWMGSPDHRWSVTLRDVVSGEVYAVTAVTIVAGVGQLSRPFTPDILGLDTFAGPVVHSANWDHSIDFANKKVAVVGTGPSAIQFVPEVLKSPGVRMTVFQRSPGYVVNKGNFKYPAFVIWLFRYVPFARALYRAYHINTIDLFSYAFNKKYPFAGKIATFIFTKYMESQVKDPKLRKALIPTFELGCKRSLFSDDWLACMQQENVTLVTDKIARITPSSLVARSPDGRESLFDADILLLGTGFKTTEFLDPIEFYGVNGTRLKDVWASKGGPEAYKGVCVAGFPNLFLLFGPNSNLGHHSVILMIEHAMSLTTRLMSFVFPLSKSARPIPYVNVTDSAQDSYNREIQALLAKSTFSSPTCTNWYRIGDKVVNNWPKSVNQYRKTVNDLAIDDFEQFGDEPKRTYRKQQLSAFVENFGRVAIVTAAVVAAARFLRVSRP
ncbi:hypothetical protein DFJ73DRAFT_841561 [Zopfochytrium polystomum]|nr:hypothetical protein DFJ73DRAFT_841561 [Zopfochytrium polystomum]